VGVAFGGVTGRKYPAATVGVSAVIDRRYSRANRKECTELKKEHGVELQ
jgi:hypothetical protein